MAIYRLLREGHFNSDEMRRMAAAYEAALEILHLKDRDDPVTELIAKKIVEITCEGESDTPRICARALKELGIPVPD